MEEKKKEEKWEGGTNQIQFGCFVKLRRQRRRLQSKFFYFHGKKILQQV